MPKGVYATETARKIANALMGRKLSPEHAAKNRTVNLGRRASDELRQRFRVLALKRGSMPPHSKGENHYRWIKDRTKVKQYWTERNNPEYKQWRVKVFERDKYKCQMHNGDCCGKIIAHHILVWRDYPELRYEVNNGITLCHFHHPQKRVDEKRLSPYFQEIINIKQQ